MLSIDMLPKMKPQGTGDRFSQNLHDWCKKHFREHPGRGLEVHSHTNADGTALYVGWVFDGELIGSRLHVVLCNGALAKIWSFSFETVPVPDFWERYLEHGKCVLDVEHRFYDERWGSEQARRVCRWCGLTQVKETYVVERTRWVTAREAPAEGPAASPDTGPCAQCNHGPDHHKNTPSHGVVCHHAGVVFPDTICGCRLYVAKE